MMRDIVIPVIIFGLIVWLIWDAFRRKKTGQQQTRKVNKAWTYPHVVIVWATKRDWRVLKAQATINSDDLWAISALLSGMVSEKVGQSQRFRSDKKGQNMGGSNGNGNRQHERNREQFLDEEIFTR